MKLSPRVALVCLLVGLAVVTGAILFCVHKQWMLSGCLLAIGWQSYLTILAQCVDINKPTSPVKGA